MIAVQRFHFPVAGFAAEAVLCQPERLCQVVLPDQLVPVGLQPQLVLVVLPDLLVRLRLPCPVALKARVVRELLLVVVAVVAAVAAVAQ